MRPPTNHLAWGAFHSRTRSHMRIQWSCWAMPDQNSSGWSMDWRYMRAYSSLELTRARETNLAGGGKMRVSCIEDSMLGWESDIARPPGIGVAREMVNGSGVGRQMVGGVVSSQ